MAMSRATKENLISDIFAQIDETEQISAVELAAKYGVTAKSIFAVLTQLINGQKIKRTQKGRYELVYDFKTFQYQNNQLKEDLIWRADIYPNLPDMNDNATRGLNYAFTEIFNNAIDHSQSDDIAVVLGVSTYKVKIWIQDSGIGIFENIKRALGLEEKRFAILELAKGKFTSDPDSHSGEGIFFSSKICNRFVIISDEFAFSSDKKSEQAILKRGDNKAGTEVYLEMLCNSPKSLRELFEQYTEAPEAFGFNKTIVPVKLLEYGDDAPIFNSRSQAKRLLMRFEKFENIVLDFEGIQEIGQAFADEIFRVFRNAHPNTEVQPVNCNEYVLGMIFHVTGKNRYE